jgi:hypothetical protein
MIDLRKAMHEMERMNRGEIPIDVEYLNELIEYNGDGDPPRIEATLVCSDCGAHPAWVDCPECGVTKQADCWMCEGEGGFYECPNCSGGDEVEV